MMNFKRKINETLKKKGRVPETSNFCTYSNQEENASIDEQTKNKCANEICTYLHIDILRFQDRMNEIGIDVDIALQIYELLSSGSKALDEIRNSICEFMNPEDIDNQHLPLKVEMVMKKLEDNDFIMIDSYSGGLVKYCLDEKFLELTRGEGSC